MRNWSGKKLQQITQQNLPIIINANKHINNLFCDRIMLSQSWILLKYLDQKMQLQNYFPIRKTFLSKIKNYVILFRLLYLLLESNSPKFTYTCTYYCCITSLMEKIVFHILLQITFILLSPSSLFIIVIQFFQSKAEFIELRPTDFYKTIIFCEVHTIEKNRASKNMLQCWLKLRERLVDQYSRMLIEFIIEFLEKYIIKRVIDTV